MNSSFKRQFLASLWALCVLFAHGASAAPDEIKVYTDEVNASGQFKLEQHINYVVQGQQVASYAGQLPSNHVLQLTPELSYGISDALEAALYLPTAVALDGNAYFNGARLSLKYLAPRAKGRPFFYGVGIEMGNTSTRISESNLVMELRPIVGFHSESWLLSFNPIFNSPLSNNVSHQTLFEPALKLTHRVSGSASAGIEYYGEYGAYNQFLPNNQRSHTSYAVLDMEVHDFDVSFGIGRGFVNAVDDWVAKAVIELPLN